MGKTACIETVVCGNSKVERREKGKWGRIAKNPYLGCVNEVWGFGEQGFRLGLKKLKSQRFM